MLCLPSCIRVWKPLEGSNICPNRRACPSNAWIRMPIPLQDSGPWHIRTLCKLPSIPLYFIQSSDATSLEVAYWPGQDSLANRQNTLKLIKKKKGYSNVLRVCIEEKDLSADKTSSRDIHLANSKTLLTKKISFICCHDGCGRRSMPCSLWPFQQSLQKGHCIVVHPKYSWHCASLN